MGAKLGSGGGLMSDMNVTPLIDVVLVLLVVFMVITPMLQTGLEVELPNVPVQAEDGTVVVEVNAEAFITISVTKDDRLAVQTEIVTKETLIEYINMELAIDGERYAKHFAQGKSPETAPQPRKLLIKSDGAVPYGKVREIMDLISDGGWPDIKLAVNEEA